MSSKYRPKVNDIVQVVFFDHAQDAKDALKFEVFGRVTAITKRAYVVHFWRYVNDVDRVVDGNRRGNEDCFAIVKSAIESIRKLK